MKLEKLEITDERSNVTGGFLYISFMASVNELKSLFGEPSYKEPEWMVAKTINEWYILVDNEDVIWIYDWKYVEIHERMYNDDDLICWHIGGESQSKEAALKVQEYITGILSDDKVSEDI